VDRDDAVLGLADRAAPLPLHAGGLVPLLDVAGLVEDGDGVGAGALVADDLLEAVAGLVMVPGVLAKELLEGADRHTGVDGDGLDALLGDVGELTADVHRQMGAGVLARETVVEPLEELAELWLELSKLLYVHARFSVNDGGEHTSATAAVSSRLNLAL
jgi:hypothetical protein